MNTIILIAIAVGFVLVIAEILHEVFQDRPTATPPQSHFQDPMLRSPGAWS